MQEARASRVMPQLEALEAQWARLHALTGADSPDDVISHWKGAAGSGGKEAPFLLSQGWEGASLLCRQACSPEAALPNKLRHQSSRAEIKPLLQAGSCCVQTAALAPFQPRGSCLSPPARPTHSPQTSSRRRPT